jgi:hypothetical protein
MLKPNFALFILLLRYTVKREKHESELMVHVYGMIWFLKGRLGGAYLRLARGGISEPKKKRREVWQEHCRKQRAKPAESG